jgi:adenylosuccinate synthase
MTAKLSRSRPMELYRPDDEEWAREIEGLLGAPVMVESAGPASSDKRIRRLATRQEARLLGSGADLAA